jgi:hypothetical protein
MFQRQSVQKSLINAMISTMEQDLISSPSFPDAPQAPEQVPPVELELVDFSVDHRDLEKNLYGLEPSLLPPRAGELAKIGPALILHAPPVSVDPVMTFSPDALEVRQELLGEPASTLDEFLGKPKGRGGFRPGSGRKGLPVEEKIRRATEEGYQDGLKDGDKMAWTHLSETIGKPTIQQLAKGGKGIPPEVRLRAAQELINRAEGKPTEMLRHSGTVIIEEVIYARPPRSDTPQV